MASRLMGPSIHLWHDEERHRSPQTSLHLACWWQRFSSWTRMIRAGSKSVCFCTTSMLANCTVSGLPCRWRVGGALALLLASKSFNVLVGVLSLRAGTLV